MSGELAPAGTEVSPEHVTGQVQATEQQGETGGNINRCVLRNCHEALNFFEKPIIVPLNLTFSTKMLKNKIRFIRVLVKFLKYFISDMKSVIMQH